MEEQVEEKAEGREEGREQERAEEQVEGKVAEEQAEWARLLRVGWWTCQRCAHVGRLLALQS